MTFKVGDKVRLTAKGVEYVASDHELETGETADRDALKAMVIEIGEIGAHYAYANIPGFVSGVGNTFLFDETEIELIES